MTITHVKLRQLFSDFWSGKNHKEVPPIPLVPKDDPTTLFTGSGMQQLVPYLSGETHPLGQRLYNIQRSLRSQDIDEVGDNRHTTMFEMMGNWSLGDYFKKEQLAWFWEFLTKLLQLPKEKLYVSVFAGTKDVPEDRESYEIWKSLGLSEDHIHKYGAEKNWWSRAGVPDNMPKGEPGGPDSEVFYDFGTEYRFHENSPHAGKPCHINCDCGRFLEIGNSVFIQYRKAGDRLLEELPKKNVDFGGGLERIMAAIEDNPDIFTTSLYQPIIRAVETTTGKKYTDPKNTPSMRIIADHLKAAIFLIKDGVLPSNKEQGYVLRRLMRRSAVKMYQLKEGLLDATDFNLIGNKVIDIYTGVYFDEKNDTSAITPIVSEELTRFNKTLSRGLKEIKKIADIDGKQAFDFYQSYGFPLELTEELLREKGQTVDKNAFYQEFQKHKELSRSASIGKFKGGLADQSQQTLKYHTATHLIHQALFEILGNEVRQEGSNINSDRLRFDFYSLRKPTDEEIKKITETVNKKIQERLPVESRILPKKDAFELGAKSFFKEKYPDTVKVYLIGSFSKELCGGPHVKNTGEIGRIDIYKLEKIGSNLFRIYAK
ncbi:alanine--tRNA ligase [Candidatus Roizmanbacteria bacterium]|jgi:alanyl-tRNA synthetase|nr:alanine--tRNA ligase [Candidatus Roizmanbacteria bacterium]